jgi:hypothetical protein
MVSLDHGRLIPRTDFELPPIFVVLLASVGSAIVTSFVLGGLLSLVLHHLASWAWWALLCSQTLVAVVLFGALSAGGKADEGADRETLGAHELPRSAAPISPK